MARRSSESLAMGIALSSLVLASATPGETCNPEFENSWGGTNSNLWSDPGNWSRDLTPDPCDNLIFPTAASMIADFRNTSFDEGSLYTPFGEFEWGWRFQSFKVTPPAVLPSAGSAAFDDFQDSAGVILIEGDAVRDSTDPDSIGDFVVKVGNGPYDPRGVLVGDPQSNPPVPGSAYGLGWNVKASGALTVTDRLGCGSVTSGGGRITVGYKLTSFGGEMGQYTYAPLDRAQFAGVIDPSLCAAPETGQSVWNLKGSWRGVRARVMKNVRTLNLDESSINHVWIDGLLRATDFTYQGTWGRDFYGGFYGSEVYVGYDEQLGNTQDGSGLRVPSPGHLTMERYVGVYQDESRPRTGPRLKTASLRVDPGGKIILRDGSELTVGPIGPEQAETGEFFEYPDDAKDILAPWHTWDPHEGVFDGSLLGAASLRYGRSLDIALPLLGQEAGDPGERISLFEAQGHPRTDPSQAEETKLPRNLPPLIFTNGAFIAPEVSLATDDSQALRLRLQVNLQIESRLSSLPGRSWDTSQVDLSANVNTAGECLLPPIVELDCDDDTAVLCPIELEAIASDDGPVWFIDLPSGVPSCRKFWRSFRLGEQNGYETYTRLVDRFNNHLPDPNNPTGLPCENEAMYVLGDVKIFDTGGLPLRLGDHKLYYGGDLFVGPELLPWAPPAWLPVCPAENIVKLVKTVYGDFNGDCEIDEDDLCIWEMYHPLNPSLRKTPRAYFDYDGDCLVGPTDWQVFNERLHWPGGFDTQCAPRDPVVGCLSSAAPPVPTHPAPAQVNGAAAVGLFVGGRTVRPVVCGSAGNVAIRILGETRTTRT